MRRIATSASPGLRRSLAALAVAVAAAAAVAAEDPGEPLAVRTHTVELQPVAETRELVGTVRARTSATVAAQVMGTVTEVAVRAGETVTAGQELARIRDRAAAAELERAAAELRRYDALLAKQAVTRAEHEAVVARYRTAAAAVAHTRVLAPIAGVVTQRLVEPGDLAAAGRPLLVIEQVGGWRLEVEVPERHADLIAEGDSLAVRIDASGEECAGTVAEVTPAADPTTRGFTVKIDLDCRQPVRSGFFGRALLRLGERRSIVVPVGAVRERGQLNYVFVAEDGRARMRLVRTGRVHGGSVEILSGLEPGDRVVVSAAGEPSDGRPLTASQP
jgi:membrane fusion protein, multidrug efflux system